MTAQFGISVLGLLVVLTSLGIWALARSLARGNRTAHSVDVYKDQLRSLGKDLARGVVTQTEFDALRAEIGRRALAAERLAAPTAQQSGRPWLAFAVMGLLAVAGAGVVYPTLGQPGATDAPLAARYALAQEKRLNRISQATAEQRLGPQTPTISAEDAGLVQNLIDVLERRPDDATGFALLAQTQAQLGDAAAAHRAQARVIALLGDAVRAEDHQRHAEYLIVAAGGYVSPEAETALRQTLQLDPSAPLARFRLGTLYQQIGRADLQFQTWDRLAREEDPALPFMPIVVQELPLLAELAGIQRYQLPVSNGPDAETIADAAQLSDADQQAMIEGMVNGLADRLGTEGGPVADWARLITSLAVLDRSDQAQAIYNNAKVQFAQIPSALDILKQAATQSGLTP